MFSSLRYTRKGFTLVELTVVVVVIGILASIGLAHFADIREKAYVAAMKNDLNNYAKAQAMYESQTPTFANTPTDLAGAYHYSPDVSTYRAIGGPTRWWLVVKYAKTKTRCRWGYGDIPDRYRPMVCGQVDIPAMADFAYTPKNPAPAANVSFDGTASQQNSPAAPLTYSWNFGDGATATTAATSHAYAADGDYTVKLVVLDTLGQADSTSQVVHVGAGGAMGGSGFVSAFNYSPSAPQDGDYITFTSASTPAPGRTVASYQWNFGDGYADSVSATNDPVGWFSPTGNSMYIYNYAGPGTYTVALTLTDDSGAQATVSHQVVVTPLNFVARLTLSPYNQMAAPGDSLTLDASTSTDVRHLGTTYEFDVAGYDASFNTVLDTVVTGPQSVRKINVPTIGQYFVDLIMSDTVGRSSYASDQANVLGAAAVAFTYAPHPLLPDSAVQFTQQSINTVSSSWNFGDGTPVVADPTPTHTYSSPGTYTVTLTGIDGSGQPVSTARPIIVGPPPGHAAPIPLILSMGANGNNSRSADGTTGTAIIQTTAYTSSCGGPRSTLNFDASASKAIGGYIVGYHWDWGDGIGVSDRESDGYAWDVPGTYLVTLSVEDSYGSTGMSQMAITIVSCNPTDPTFKPLAWIFLTPQTVMQGSSFQASANAIDGGSGLNANIASYQWNLGDLGGAQTGQTVTGTAAPNATLGGHPITVTVTDMNGMPGDASAVVTVVDTNPPPVVAITQSTFSAALGQQVVFDGSSSTVAPGQSIVSYTWDLGDGDALQTLSTPAIGPSYSWKDVFIVRLLITDSLGKSAWGATWVRVDGANAPSSGECIPAAGCITSGPGHN